MAIQRKIGSCLDIWSYEVGRYQVTGDKFEDGLTCVCPVDKVLADIYVDRSARE